MSTTTTKKEHQCEHTSITVLECYDDVKLVDVAFVIYDRKEDIDEDLLKIAHIAKIFCHDCRSINLGRLFVLDEVLHKNL
jgi:hypothetical protein